MLVEIYPIETVRRAAARSYSLGVGVGVAAMSGNVEVSFCQILRPPKKTVIFKYVSKIGFLKIN